jgi:hypothetical protein
MHQVKRTPEDPKLFEQLLLSRVIAIIAGDQKVCSFRHLVPHWSLEPVRLRPDCWAKPTPVMKRSRTGTRRVEIGCVLRAGAARPWSDFASGSEVFEFLPCTFSRPVQAPLNDSFAPCPWALLEICLAGSPAPLVNWLVWMASKAGTAQRSSTAAGFEA